MEKSRDLFPGHVGHGPEAQKSQPLSRGHLRQGRGFQVQNRLGQPGQWYSLTLFMDNAGGGDQAPGDRGKPPFSEGPHQERQGPGGSRMRAWVELTGVGIIVPEALAQDQISGRQPRGQGAAEPQGDQEVGTAAVHQDLPGPAGRRRAHPGQGRHSRPRLKLPGRQPQVPTGPGLDPAQKRPHFQGECSHNEDPAGPGGVPAHRRRGHQGLGNGRWSRLGGSGPYNSGWAGAVPTCLGPRQRRPFTRRLPFLWSTVWSSRIISPCLAEMSE